MGVLSDHGIRNGGQIETDDRARALLAVMLPIAIDVSPAVNASAP